MSSLFSSPKSPPAPIIMQAPPPPKITDPSITAAQAALAANVAQARGRQSTILTSGLGDTTKPSLDKKQLLGA